MNSGIHSLNLNSEFLPLAKIMGLKTKMTSQSCEKVFKIQHLSLHLRATKAELVLKPSNLHL